ncbi:hypothetical protein EON65_43995 [archaeon]|nr:MAG: hypothetical protein EON65_43995 [archaeon]
MLLTKEGLLQKGHADSEAGREGCIHMLVRDLEWHIEEFDEERKAFEGGEDEKSHTWIIVRDKLRGVLSLLRRPVKGAKVLDNGGGSQVYVHATSTSNMVEEGEAVEEESETE